MNEFHAKTQSLRKDAKKKPGAFASSFAPLRETALMIDRHAF